MMAINMARGDGYSIIKRKRNGRELRNYEVRILVPTAWQAKVGKKEALLSLGTGDRRAANVIALQIVAHQYTEWQRIADKTLDVRSEVTDPRAIAVKVAYDGMLDALEKNRRLWPTDDVQYTAQLAQREIDLLRLTRRFQDGDLSQWEAMADRAFKARGLTLDKNSNEYKANVEAFALGSIDAIGVFNRRVGGELEAAPRTTLVQEAKSKQAAKAKSGETILELFERWAEEMLAKGVKRSDTVNQDRKVIESFAAFVGADRDIRSITPIEVAAYRDTLRDLPPKWMSKRELRHLEMRPAAAKARTLDMPRTAYTTINKQLSTISPLYKWIARHPTWAGHINPCNGLFYDKVKGKNRRPPFKTVDLKNMLHSPLFTGFKEDGEEHIPGDKQADDWRYWIPLTALFTGARIGEIAQLRLCDVCEEHGVWFIHIRHDKNDGLTTKNGMSRAVAVHTTLEKIGFLAFHARQLQRAGGDNTGPLFAELTRNVRGQISAVPSRWWRDYLTRIKIKDPDAEGGDGFGAHSFRHTLADRLRTEAELLDNEIAVCLGHNMKSTTSEYGELPQGTVKMLKGYMDALRFDGLDFNHLCVRNSAA